MIADYIETWDRHDGLLFPSLRGGMLKDVRGSLKKAIASAKIDKHVTFHTLRHTYAATRMQTLDHGAPVSPYTVMREMGHKSLELILETYGHLQNTRHRSEHVEYREVEVLSISEAQA